MAYFNCDNNEILSNIFDSDYNMSRILLSLSSYIGFTIEKENTLIVFDEVQENPRILNALKYFNEEAPEYHIIVAGSLLGISLHSSISFPVGKVDMLKMYPLTFNEFLTALNEEALVSLQTTDPTLIDTFAPRYIDLLRQYYYVGGMPAVVDDYRINHDLNSVRKLQKNILFNYSRDFSKHAPKEQIPRINMVWNSIPSQLAKDNKKFIYGAMKKSARATEFEIAIQWLIDAGLVYQIFRAEKPALPLKFYEDTSAFKLFILDVGLMGAMTDTPSSQVLLEKNFFTEYKGAFTELYVLTQLKTMEKPIYYFSANNSQVEINFLVQDDERIVPLEVKAEVSVRSKSLRTYIERNPELKGLRLSMQPYINQSWMSNQPLYAVNRWFTK